jgi:O-antigen/teichoic acid export membrane protein
MLAGSPSFGLFGARTIAFGITFAVPLFLVRVLTTEDFGLYKQAFLLHSTLLPIFQFGLPASLLYFAINDRANRSTYVFNTLILLSAFSILGAGLLFSIAYWNPHALGVSTLLPLIPPLSGLLTLSLLASPLEPLLFASRAFRLAAGVQVASDAVRALLVTIAAGLGGGVPSILAAAIIWAGARCVGLAACFSRLGVSLPRKLDSLALSRQCKYALPFALAVIVGTCADGLHLYVVAFSFPLSVFAIYSVGVLQIPLVDLVFQSVADIGLVRLTALAQEQRLPEIRALVSRTVGQIAAPLLPLYVWLALNANDVIRILYTERFADSVPIFQIFLLTIPLTAIGLDYVPRAFADTGFLLRANICRLVLAIALVVPLVFILGPVGAAAGTVAALAITRLAFMVRVTRLTQTPLLSLLPWGSLLRIAVLSTAVGIVTIALTHVLLTAATARLVVGTPIFVLGYAALAWRLGILNRETKEWLAKPSVLVNTDSMHDV